MPRSLSANGRSHGWSQRSRSQSASQTLRRQFQSSRHVDAAADALSKDLESVAAELAEVKEVLRNGGSFLGLSGTLLQEYFIELAKKDNLLRAALSRASPSAASKSACEAPPSRPPSKRRSQTCDATLLQAASAPSSPGKAGNLQPASAPSSPEKPPHMLQTALVPSSHLPLSERNHLPETTAASPSNAEVNWSILAEVLDFLDAFAGDSRAQQRGIRTLGRLAREASQLRPLCLAATLTVARCISNFPFNLLLNRLSVTALGNIAYLPDVAAVIVHEALPALFAAMINHASDEKLQVLACEALARMFQAGELVVVKAMVHTMLSHTDSGAVEACCTNLARLHEGGICKCNQVLDVLVAMTESQPSDLDLQQRAAAATQLLVCAGAVNEADVKSRAPPLLSHQWVQLLQRFLKADQKEADQTTRFHAEVQTVFHEEVVKHFEYEAAERSLHLLCREAPGTRPLKEVIRCLVENLEDYQVRLESRELAWDPTERSLVPLDAELRDDLCAQALASMESGLIESLQVVAAADSPHGQQVLIDRTSRLRNECAALLARKTEVTQVHQERSMELRREFMVFEVVDHLELRDKVDLSLTQVQSALHMLETVETDAPPDAVQRLRDRLHDLSHRLQIQNPTAVPAG